MVKHELAVIVPVYNEEAAIREVLEKWTNLFKILKIDFKVHLYNDGSGDRTLEVITMGAEKNKKLVVHNKTNSGHGPTILLGYRENIHAKWIFQMDSDDEMEPDAFVKLWVNREKYDFLIGNRKHFNQPLMRKIISAASRLVIKSFYGTRVHDVNSPYRLMRVERFKELFFALPNNIFAPNVVISGWASLNKLRIYEIDVFHRSRRTGSISNNGLKMFKLSLFSFWQTICFRLSNIYKETGKVK